MSDVTASAPRSQGRTGALGMEAVSPGLWLSLAAAAVQISSIASDFYIVGGDTTRSAWFGIPHASELVLASALVTIVLAALSAGNRSPVRGRNVGLLVGVIGLLATAQIAYRMILPPFGGCLTYWACGTQQTNVTLLPGIWMALIGSGVAALGGFAHAASGKARNVAPNFWAAERQEGMTPWLGLAGLGAVIALVMFGFTFYTITQEGSTTAWSGWIAAPHTSVIVVYMALLVVGLVIAAGRQRSPMSPAALGAVIALIGFIGAFRIFYRILVPPFTSGPAEGVFQQAQVQIGIAAYISLAGAVVVVLTGIAQAVSHRSQGAPDVAARREPASRAA